MRKALDCIPIRPKIAPMEQNRNLSKHWLALRYLKGRSSGPINRSHYLTLAGILLGVTALICVSSVMNGFRADIRGRIIGAQSEIRVSHAQGKPLSDYNAVIGKLNKLSFQAAPVIRNELVIKRGQAIFPTLSFGIDPMLQPKVSDVLRPRPSRSFSRGMGILEGQIGGSSFSPGGIALGSTLAQNLNVRLGDEVQLLSPMFDIPTAFGLLPRVRTMRVAAIFSADMPDYDRSFSFIPLEAAGFFSGYQGEIDYLEVRSPDFDRSGHYVRQLRKALPGYKIEDWSAYDSSLYGAIRFEKYMMFVIMLFMYIIASFNLTGNMLKAIAQKKRDLGLLKAIGYTSKDLRDLFLHQSIMLSTLGILLGIALASLLLWLQVSFHILTLDMGDIVPTPLPVRVMPLDYVVVVAVSYLITLLSVIFPLRRLRSVNPVDLLRQTT